LISLIISPHPVDRLVFCFATFGSMIALLFQDKAVSKEEWLDMWTGIVDEVKSSKTLPEWQVQYLNFFFDASDTSGKPSFHLLRPPTAPHRSENSQWPRPT
jgi:hypothetical protein